MIDDDVKTMKISTDDHDHIKYFKGFYTASDNEKAFLRFRYCHPRDVTIKK